MPCIAIFLMDGGCSGPLVGKGFVRRTSPHANKNSRLVCCEAGTLCVSYLVVLSVDEHAVPLRLLSKVKIGIGVKVGGELHVNMLGFFCFSWQR